MTELSGFTLPSPPGAAMRLLELYSNPQVSTSDIADVISLDATLTARLLRVANSPFFGQQAEVGSVQRAIVVLGTEYVKMVSLGFHLLESCNSWEESPIDTKAIWRGNVLRACLARQIAMQSKVFPHECRSEGFLVGLLQDLAVPLIATKVGSGYSDWLASGESCTTSDTCEREIGAVAVSHAELVQQLFEHWSFPSRLSFAMGKHHVEPSHERTSEEETCLWQLAYFVATTPFDEQQQTATVSKELRHLASEAFGLEGESLAHVFYGAVDDYDALASMFDVVLSDDITSGVDALHEAWRLVMQTDADAAVVGHSS